MENEMETTIMGYIGIIGYILGLRVWGLGFWILGKLCCNFVRHWYLG